MWGMGAVAAAAEAAAGDVELSWGHQWGGGLTRLQCMSIHKRVNGRSHSMEERISTHYYKPHARRTFSQAGSCSS